MHINCATVQYMHCHIALYVFKDDLRKIQATKQKLQIFPFIFHSNSNSLRILSKRTSSSHISYALTVYCLLVLLFMTAVLLSLSQSLNKSQHTNPIHYTAYSCSQMQYFSAFWSFNLLYIPCHFIDILRSYSTIN
jgi:hypothetical protein